MESFGFIAWILIGIVAGWLAEKILKRNDSLVINLVSGVIGGLLGGWLLQLINVDTSGYGWFLTIVTATLGAVIVLTIVSFFTKKKTV